ncbi:MAG: hypothetical protein A2X81_04270 [Desulfobacterales bacterium GWB2_56_26]|nr:MAG: hypothetical protein A2X81_04270 [Desulfobacterales bacterium GWB2_56_26]
MAKVTNRLKSYYVREANDAQREATDIYDMRLLLDYQLQRKRRIDWELLDEYFSLFNKHALLAALKKDFS